MAIRASLLPPPKTPLHAGAKAPAAITAPAPITPSRPGTGCVPCHWRWGLRPSDSGPSACNPTTLTRRPAQLPGDRPWPVTPQAQRGGAARSPPCGSASSPAARRSPAARSPAPPTSSSTAPSSILEADQYAATVLPVAGRLRGLLVRELDGPPPVRTSVVTGHVRRSGPGRERPARHRDADPPGNAAAGEWTACRSPLTAAPQARRHGKRGCPGPFSRFRGSPFRCSGAQELPYTSFDMFGPAPPAACSIGGTSGRADFSSPRKVNFFSSPSPSVPTTTM